jgi:phospholipid transport system substrate-binding protein
MNKHRAHRAGVAIAGIGLVAALGVVAPAESSAQAGEARAVVDQTVDTVLAVLRQPELSVFERRAKIEEIAYARFDFDTMSRLVLSRNWRKFDAANKRDFIDEFKRHLARSYGQRVERYEDEEVTVEGERVEKRGDVTVLTVIHGGAFDGARIGYRLRNRDGEWRVIDVLIEGVSLVGNYRSQFKDIVSRDGPAGLIAQLHEKNAAAADSLAP